MAHLPLLTLVQSACGEMGIPAPSAVAGNTDATAQQMLALAHREGKECIQAANQAGGWQFLRKENLFQVQSTGIIPGCSFTVGSNVITIGTPPTQAPQVGWVLSTSGGSNATGFVYPTTIVSVVGNQVTVSSNALQTDISTNLAFGQQSYTLPTDFDYMIPGTFWDRGFRWQVYGPITPQEWQVLKSGLSPTGPRRRFRIMNGAINIDPIPYDSNWLVYEYYSRGVALAADGVTVKTQFSADTDTYQIDDDLLILGLIWRYRRAKGLDYSEEKRTYDDALARKLARDASSQSLQLDIAVPDVRLLTSSQIPDTGFGTT